MITLRRGDYEITICDCFSESIISILKANSDLLAADVEELLFNQILAQERNPSDYYTLTFDKNASYEALSKEQVIQFSVPKSFVFVKLKPYIKIRKGSFYESLNEDASFLRALNEGYKEKCKMYAYYIPISFSKKILNKRGDNTSIVILTVDIPFHELEVPE